MYSYGSGKDGGTLYQLRNLINRRNVVKKPKKNVTACEEFFELVVEAHILTAVMNEFEMNSLEDEPNNQLLLTSADLCASERSSVLPNVIEQLLKSLIDISFPSSISQSNVDPVCEYAKEVLLLGLHFLEFHDAIWEGDGDRLLRCWKYFLPLYKATNRKNYAIEAFTMLAQYYFLFTPRMHHQLLWSCIINSVGRAGHNIPCDLHMEHINRQCKNAMGTLGPNVNQSLSVTRISRSIRPILIVTDSFD